MSEWRWERAKLSIFLSLTVFFSNSSRGLLPNFLWFMFFYSFNASRDGYLVQFRTETLIVTMPTPDFSMPYNVICLACTVVALAFGPLHNITTKRYWYETESIHISVYVKIMVPPHTKHIELGKIQTVNSLYSFTALPVELFYQMQNYIFLIVFVWETGVHITFNTTKPEGNIPFGRYRCSTRVHRSQVNTFCMVTPNVYRSSVWKLLHVTLLAPGIFE